MRLRLDPEEAEVVGAFRARDRTAGTHARVRALTCPFDRVGSAVPAQGAILDLGCGHGLFSLLLARRSPQRTVTGLDHDGRKLEIARGVAADLGTDVHFAHGDGDIPAAGAWDAIVVVDVLYLLGQDRAMEVLASAAAALAPGGALVVKEIAMRPRWKYVAAVAQERLATGPLGITRGAGVAFVDPGTIVRQMRDSGLTVGTRSIDRGYPHPHLLFVGKAVPRARGEG